MSTHAIFVLQPDGKSVSPLLVMIAPTRGDFSGTPHSQYLNAGKDAGRKRRKPVESFQCQLIFILSSIVNVLT